MKKVLTIIAAVAALVACSKVETPAQKEEVNDVTHGKKMVLFAEVPEMTTEDGTKAIADGSFSWSEGDEIAIPLKTGYAVFVYSAENKQFEYTLAGNEEFVAGTAYYPASSRPGGSYSTSFADATKARAGFKMEASYTLGASSLSFTHKSALISLNFTNVPSFATSVVVKKGGAPEATVALSSPSSTVSLKVPVTPAASTNYSFALMEGSNIIREVGKTVTINAGTCYSTPEIAINKYFVFSGTGLSGIGKLRCKQKVGDGWGSNDYTWDLKTTSGGTKYCVLPFWDWLESGDAVYVEAQSNGGSKVAGVDYYYVRNTSFTINSGEDFLRTNYRIYPNGKSVVYAHIWEGEDAITGSWPGKNAIPYYEFDYNYSGHNVNVILNNNNNGKQTATWNIWVSRDYDYGIDIEGW